MRIRLVVVLALLLPALVVAAPSGARTPKLDRTGKQIVRDCADNNALDRVYRVASLRRALRAIPTDVSEYTECEDLIRRAIRRGGDGRRAGRASVAAVVADCRADGRLNRRYPLATLRRSVATFGTSKRGRKCRAVVRAEVRRRT